MSPSEARFLMKPAELSCPECQVGLPFEEFRGEAFCCPNCQSWLYRAIWERPRSDLPRCHSCRGPVDDSGACYSCGKEPTWWQRCLRSRWGSWIPRRADRDIEQVPLQFLRCSTGPQRLSVDLQDYESLCHSISELGLIQPLLVRAKGGDGVYPVISRHRRLMALRQLQWSHAPVRVLNVSEEQGARIRLSENRHRESLQPLELAELFEKIFLCGDESREALSSKLAIQPREVARLLSLLESPPWVREAMVYSLARSSGRFAEEEEEISSPENSVPQASELSAEAKIDSPQQELPSEEGVNS